MKQITLLLICAAIIGCNPTTPDGPTTSASTQTGTPSAASNVTGAPLNDSATTGETAGTTGDGAEAQAHKDDVPNRVFQLRNLAVTTVTSKSNSIKAWVMDTPAKREEGMMWLKDQNVKDNEGMLFVFPTEDSDMGFWMDNTILPLDIIFINKDRKVLNIQMGKPFDQTNLPTAGPAMYVLELKQGMAKKFEIKAGDVLKWPNSVKAAN